VATTVERSICARRHPDARPTFGLDDGETDGIVLSNALDVDGFLTDEFGGTNFPLIHAVLQGPRIVPTPRLICDYARNGHMTHEEGANATRRDQPHRAGTDSPYVAQLVALLESRFIRPRGHERRVRRRDTVSLSE